MPKIAVVGLPFSEIKDRPLEALVGNRVRAWALHTLLEPYELESWLYVDGGARIADEIRSRHGDRFIRSHEELLERANGGEFDAVLLASTKLQFILQQHPWLRDLTKVPLVGVFCYDNNTELDSQVVRRMIGTAFVTPVQKAMWDRRTTGVPSFLITPGEVPCERAASESNGDVAYVGFIHSVDVLRLIADTARSVPEHHFHLVCSEIRERKDNSRLLLDLSRCDPTQRETALAEFAEANGISWPFNLTYQYLPHGEEGDLLDRATVGLDFSWSEDQNIENTKVARYLVHGLAPVVQLPAPSHRYVERFDAGAVLPFHATLDDWVRAVRAMSRTPLETKNRIRAEAGRHFSWSNFAFEVGSWLQANLASARRVETHRRAAASGTASTRPSLESFRDKFRGRRAFIIGNGPSLARLDLSLLKNEITFGVNSIFYHFDEMGFKPTFYVVEDKLVAEDRAAEINALNGTTKIFGEYLNYCLADRDDVMWANVIFDYRDYPEFPHFSTNAAERMWVGGTVSYLCMQLAYTMGFDEVYLIGFDHNYSIPKDARIEGTVITSASDDPNHFHPEYFGKGKRWHDPRLDRMEKAYRKAKIAFEADGRRILNATVGGKLDIFPRVDFESLFVREKEPQKPRISVVVCTYRNPELLEKTLDSLAAQTLPHRDFEVVVVDNNSGDSTPDVVQRYRGFRYVHEPVLGLSHARNRGIREARADIVAFIDDDAEASPQWVSELLNGYAERPRAWAVGGPARPIWDAPRPSWLTAEYFRSLSLVEWGDMLRPLTWPERLIGVNCSFRRSVFETVGSFDTGLGRIGKNLLDSEDAEIQKRIHEVGGEVVYNPRAIVLHRVPADRMTREYLERRRQGSEERDRILQLRAEGHAQKADQIADRIRVQERSQSEAAPSAVVSRIPSPQRIARVLQHSRARLTEFKDRHAGERCVIVGNGPSLSQMDLTWLEREITFGMNKIYLGFERWKWRPRYYVSVNPLVLEQSARVIEQLQCPRFLGLAGLRHFDVPNEDMIFLESRPEVAFSGDIRQGMWEGHTVTFVAMQLAYFMGFSEVALIGVDHSFAARGKPNEEVIADGPDASHFDVNYFGPGTHWHLPDLERSEMAYRLAKDAFESGGRRIVNATVGGRLEIFERVDYREWSERHTGARPLQQMSQNDILTTLERLLEDVQINPLDRETILQCGRIFTSLGQSDNAQFFYRTYLEHRPGDREISELARRLERGSMEVSAP